MASGDVVHVGVPDEDRPDGIASVRSSGTHIPGGEEQRLGPTPGRTIDAANQTYLYNSKRCASLNFGSAATSPTIVQRLFKGLVDSRRCTVANVRTEELCCDQCVRTSTTRSSPQAHREAVHTLKEPS